VLIDQLAEGDAQRQLVVAGPGHMPAQAVDLGAGAFRRADLPVGVRAVGDDPGHVGQRLDVVDDRRLVVQAAALLRREGRAHARLAEQPLDAVEQRRFLPADVSPRAEVDVHLARPAGAEDVLAEETGLPGGGDVLLQGVGQVPEFAAAVDVDGFRLDGVGGDQRAFDELVRIVLQNLAVFERARLRFVGVDHNVLDWLVPGDEAPFDAGREARAAAPAQVGGLDHVDHLIGRHGRDRLPEGLVTAVLPVNVNVVDVLDVPMPK